MKKITTFLVIITIIFTILFLYSLFTESLFMGTIDDNKLGFFEDPTIITNYFFIFFMLVIIFYISKLKSKDFKDFRNNYKRLFSNDFYYKSDSKINFVSYKNFDKWKKSFLCIKHQLYLSSIIWVLIFVDVWLSLVIGELDFNFWFQKNYYVYFIYIIILFYFQIYFYYFIIYFILFLSSFFVFLKRYTLSFWKINLKNISVGKIFDLDYLIYKFKNIYFYIILCFTFFLIYTIYWYYIYYGFFQKSIFLLHYQIYLIILIILLYSVMFFVINLPNILYYMKIEEFKKEKIGYHINKINSTNKKSIKEGNRKMIEKIKKIPSFLISPSKTVLNILLFLIAIVIQIIIGIIF